MTNHEVAVVTGAGSGIGLATAQRFLACGWSVVAADLNAQALRALEDGHAADSQSADSLRTVVVDVADEQAVRSAVAIAVTEFGALGAMVNNAGVGGAFGPITEIEAEDWEYTFRVLSTGVFFGVKHAAAAMVESRQGGSIINIASTAGLAGGISPQAYSSAKAAVISLSRTAAVELAAHRIRVNAVCPGVIGTPLVHRGHLDSFEEKLASVQPWPESGRPEDVAGAIAFLASDDSRFITGQSIVVDGGLLASGPGQAFMQMLGLDAGAAGMVGVNRGSTGQGSVVRRKDR
ncbi:SDR family oxidoreductase [Prauserella endophytica]|uniref:SDR family oxidoreductase n=1 Tax=Prauserella endophytica TaxID=1592324 RepID=A0ABY2RVE3_9PSEU|nr:SDR family oxidoreductase [Prauserella endophytica]